MALALFSHDIIINKLEVVWSSGAAVVHEKGDDW